MASKYLDPKWLTFIVTIIITAVNKYYGLHVDIGKVIAALLVVINFLIAQFKEDIARVQAGQSPRSSLFGIKTLTMAFACLLLGVGNYYDWPMTEGELMGIVGFAGLIITGKAVTDNKSLKREGGTIANTKHSNTTESFK